MATLTLNSSNWDVGQLRITYTASNGTLKITEIEGNRSGGYRSWDASDTSITVSVGGTSKSISLSHYIDFGDNEWTAWGATDTSWTGLSGTSISITTTMPSSTVAYSGAKFTGNATMSWTTYTVSYNANGGSGAPSAQTKTYGTTLTLSSTKPTRSGYTFMGWGTSASDTTVDYAAGASYTANSAITLYAIWSENKLTINYYSNYATSAFSGALNTVGSDKNVIVYTQDIYYDNDYSTYGLANYSNSTGSVYMTRTGYTGTGNWGTSTSGGTLVNENTGYATGQALAQALGKSIANGNASINLYAQWKINTYTINYNANGGSGNMSSQSVNWNQTFTLSNNTFTRDGYKFIGWNLYRNNDSKWYVIGQGWLTNNEILTGGYEKKIYENQDELIFDMSWIKGNEDSINQYTMYAIWEISGVVYIDNGTTLVPHLIYIDNGTSWDLYIAYIDDGTNWNIVS